MRSIYWFIPSNIYIRFTYKYVVINSDHAIKCYFKSTISNSRCIYQRDKIIDAQLRGKTDPPR